MQVICVATFLASTDFKSVTCNSFLVSHVEERVLYVVITSLVTGWCVARCSLPLPVNNAAGLIRTRRRGPAEMSDALLLTR